MLRFASRLVFSCNVALMQPSLAKAAPVLSPMLTVVRSKSVFGSLDAERLWEGVTGPRGQTKKRSRGKRRVTRPKIDLNYGQQLGKGRKPMVWPGLTDKVEAEIAEGVVDPDYEKNLIEYRNSRAKKRSRQILAPLERGWTGGRRGGERRSVPNFVDSVNMSGFHATILEMKMVSTMTATKGRTPTFSALVVVGNEKGVGGYAVGKSQKMSIAVNRAILRACHKLEHFQFFQDRTLWHDAYMKSWYTGIFARQTPEGFGLICHRAIKSICKSIGLKDLYAKVETSPKNYQQVTTCFFKLLREQENYQALADREQLHVVEVAPDRDDYPIVLASPQSATRSVAPDEDLDLSRYYYGGRVPNVKPIPKPAYLKGEGQQKKARQQHRYRNQNRSALERSVYEALRPNV